MSRVPPATTQTLISKEAAKPSKRALEVAGKRLAECVAVVCCCPCGLINILVLTAVKLPAGLLRRSVKGKKKKKKAVLTRPEAKNSSIETSAENLLKGAEPGVPLPEKSPAVEVMETEKKMLPQFLDAGFWRSPSQREEQ